MRLSVLSGAALLACGFLVSGRPLSTRQVFGSLPSGSDALRLPKFFDPGSPLAPGTSPPDPVAVAAVPDSNSNFDILTSPGLQNLLGTPSGGSSNPITPNTDFKTAFFPILHPQQVTQPDTPNQPPVDSPDYLSDPSTYVDSSIPGSLDSQSTNLDLLAAAVPQHPPIITALLSQLKKGQLEYCIFFFSGDQLLYLCSTKTGELKTDMAKHGSGITIYRKPWGDGVIFFEITDTLHTCQIQTQSGTDSTWIDDPNCNKDSHLTTFGVLTNQLEDAFKGVSGPNDKYQRVSYQNMGATGRQYNIPDFMEGSPSQMQNFPQ